MCTGALQQAQEDLRQGCVIGWMTDMQRASREINLEILRDRRMAATREFQRAAEVGEKRWIAWNSLLIALGERKDSSLSL